MDAFYPQALGGFIMVMTEEGELIYLTESVSRHISLTQVHQHLQQQLQQKRENKITIPSAALCHSLLMSQHPPFSLIYSSNSQCEESPL